MHSLTHSVQATDVSAMSRQSVPALSGIPWAPISLGTTWVPMEPSLGCCDTCSTLFFEARSQWSLIMKTRVGSRYQAYYAGCTALHASIDRVGPGSTTGISKSCRLNSTACPQRACWSWTQHQQTCGNYDRDWIEEVQSGRAALNDKLKSIIVASNEHYIKIGLASSLDVLPGCNRQQVPSDR